MIICWHQTTFESCWNVFQCETNTTAVVWQGLKGAVALDFDYQQQMIYWVEMISYSPPHIRISRMHISGSEVQVSVTMTTRDMLGPTPGSSHFDKLLYSTVSQTHVWVLDSFLWSLQNIFKQHYQINHMNPIWVSRVPQGSILGLFCFLLLSGKLLLKIADRQAPNAMQRVALGPCRSAVFSG